MKKTLLFAFALATLPWTGSLGADTMPIALHGIPSHLRWKNGPAAWKIEGQTDQVLTIRADGATDWYSSPLDRAIRANSPKLLFTPDDHFVLSAKVTVNLHSPQDAGVLAIYADDAIWAKLSLEMTSEGRPAIVSVVTREISDESTAIPIEGNSIYLRVAKLGPAIYFFASRDGQLWMPIRNFSLATEREIQVGFSSQSPHGEGCTTTFSEIRYSHKLLNLVTGE